MPEKHQEQYEHPDGIYFSGVLIRRGQLTVPRRQTDQAWKWNFLLWVFVRSASNPKETNRSSMDVEFTFDKKSKKRSVNSPKETNRSSVEVEFTLYAGKLKSQLAIPRKQTDQAWMWNLLFRGFNKKRSVNSPKKTNGSSMTVEFTIVGLCKVS